MKSVEKILKKNNVKSFGVLNFTIENITFNTKKNNMLDKNYKTVIMMSFPYFSNDITNGNISAYASVNDYHLVLKQKLLPILNSFKKSFYGHKFISFIDSSPINEVDLAQKSGIGVRGLNSLLITKEYGSYVFLASIITTLKLKETKKKYSTCMLCKKCIECCPTSAITKNGINKDLCLSNITQKKGDLSDYEKNIIKKTGTIWGCDICQKVCPHNKNIKETYINEFLNNIIGNLDREIIEKTYKTRAFGWRGKNILLRNLYILENS